ncbi:hypothetical protein EDD16DRAFT_1222942 [Pisolithus croceorrhizus]|nr:hypothetical protein EDD16DRAFT_1222942 [Pisolithus croceorrhizus]KAI6128018.1 hypothetical protein EV401DRAFT_2206820 [Pisolithus croceorrhizus]KAI6142269.1 hypothetical protein EDD17DRAFT_253348 [Pisolithus thermaeus]
MLLTRSSNVTIARDELAAARAELARLQDCERELLEELGSVHAAIRVQRGKINDLFQQRRLPAPITRLPLKVLSNIIHRVILDTCPESDAHRYTKRQLASVSRLWRDAIFDFPNLWTTIAIDPSWPISLVMAHVERSRDCPLNIIISNWSSCDDSFNDRLGVAITCGCRWRSLVIQQIRKPAMQIVKDIWRMRFPSLECVKIFGVQTSDNPLFLTSRCAPALKHLILWNQTRISQLEVASNLNIGEFHWSARGSGTELLSSLLPCQQLRKLVLYGSRGSGDRWPGPQSIHLPALVSLTLNLFDPQPALACMVVPSLNYLRCSRPSCSGGWVHVFEGFPDRFTNVQHICLVDPNLNNNVPFELTEADARAVSIACPGVHHLELPIGDMPVFFNWNSPVDRWLHLKCLTLEGLRVGEIPHDLIQWLDRRKSREQSLLRLKLSEFHVPEGVSNGPWLTALCRSLRGRCLFELQNFPLKTTLKVHASSQGDVLESCGNPESLRIFIDEGFEG